jgi:hypothetical protein
MVSPNAPRGLLIRGHMAVVGIAMLQNSGALSIIVITFPKVKTNHPIPHSY